MSKNKLAPMLLNAKKVGVECGLISMQMVALVALENVLPDHIDDYKVGGVLKEIEKEMGRVWRDVKGEEDAVEASELLTGHAHAIRIKRKMDEEDG